MLGSWPAGGGGAHGGDKLGYRYVLIPLGRDDLAQVGDLQGDRSEQKAIRRWPARAVGGLSPASANRSRSRSPRARACGPSMEPAIIRATAPGWAASRDLSSKASAFHPPPRLLGVSEDVMTDRGHGWLRRQQHHQRRGTLARPGRRVTARLTPPKLHEDDRRRVSTESVDRVAFVVLCGCASLAASRRSATRTPLPLRFARRWLPAVGITETYAASIRFAQTAVTFLALSAWAPATRSGCNWMRAGHTRRPQIRKDTHHV
jgi:hypothetical protein